MIKFTILLRRNPALTHEQFVEHHRNFHADLFMSIPIVRAKVRRYVQQHTIPIDFPDMPPQTFDGITELWFDSIGDIVAVFTAPEYLTRVRPDEAHFLDLHRCEFVVSEENTVFPETRP